MLFYLILEKYWSIKLFIELKALLASSVKQTTQPLEWNYIAAFDSLL